MVDTISMGEASFATVGTRMYKSHTWPYKQTQPNQIQCSGIKRALFNSAVKCWPYSVVIKVAVSRFQQVNLDIIGRLMFSSGCPLAEMTMMIILLLINIILVAKPYT